jgi:sulfatase maturation enzyme AslB (radical SAM superfamily)
VFGTDYLVIGVRGIKGLILILTAQCNARCSYCYQTAKKPLSMNWATLRTAIDLGLNSRVADIKLAFLGGEPLLEWPKIRRAVNYVDRKAPPDKHVRYAISTNGLLITEEIAAFLDDNKFSVQLSFDGVAGVQDYRQVGSFAVLDTLLDRLQESQPDLFERRLRLEMTLIPAAVPCLADSVRYLMGKGVRHISISPSVTPCADWKCDDIDQLDDQFSRVLDQSLRHFGVTGEVPLRLFRKRKDDRDCHAPCDFMCSVMNRRALVIDADGQVYGCVMFAESYQEFASAYFKSQLAPLRMGYLQDPGFAKRCAGFPTAVRRKEMFRHKARKFSSYGRCGECPHLDGCSVCPAAIGFDPCNTDPRRVPDFICAFNMVTLKYRDRFPCLPDPAQEFRALLRARSG